MVPGSPVYDKATLTGTATEPLSPVFNTEGKEGTVGAKGKTVIPSLRTAAQRDTAPPNF